MHIFHTSDKSVYFMHCSFSSHSFSPVIAFRFCHGRLYARHTSTTVINVKQHSNTSPRHSYRCAQAPFLSIPVFSFESVAEVAFCPVELHRFCSSCTLCTSLRRARNKTHAEKKTLNWIKTPKFSFKAFALHLFSL